MRSFWSRVLEEAMRFVAWCLLMIDKHKETKSRARFWAQARDGEREADANSRTRVE
jgi:hypothetical protein